MNDLLFCIGWCLCCLFFHMILHRSIQNIVIALLGSCIYFLGIPIVLGCVYMFHSNFFLMPFSTSLIIFLVGSVMFLFYYPRFLKGRVPSHELLKAFDQNPYHSYKELIHLFSESEVIDQRLSMLKEKKLIGEKNNHFSLSPKGKTIFFLVSFVRLLGKEPLG